MCIRDSFIFFERRRVSKRRGTQEKIPRFLSTRRVCLFLWRSLLRMHLKVKNYTMDGHCAFGRQWYIDNSGASSAALRYNANRFNATYLSRDHRGVNVNQYRDKNKVKPTLVKYVDAIRGQRCNKQRLK